MGRRVVLFGVVQMQEAYCPQCRDWYFVRNGLLQCCDTPASEETPTHVKRVTEPEWERARPSLIEQREILTEQNHACFYCRQYFGDVVPRGRKPVRLRIQWDHVVPYAHSGDNRASNFVAACHVCNAWKSDRIFATYDAAQEYLEARWTKARTPRAKAVR